MSGMWSSKIETVPESMHGPPLAPTVLLYTPPPPPQLRLQLKYPCGNSSSQSEPVCSSRLFFFGLAVSPNDEIPSFERRLSLSRFRFSGLALRFFRCTSLIISRRWTSSEISSVSAERGVVFRKSSSFPGISTRFRFCERLSCSLLNSVPFSSASPDLVLFFLIGGFDPDVVVEFASLTWEANCFPFAPVLSICLNISFKH